MNRFKKILSISILFSLFNQTLFAQAFKFADQKTSQKVIEFFYKEYFRLSTGEAKENESFPIFPFSKSFLEHVKKYNSSCNKNNENCPWNFEPRFKAELDSTTKYKDLKIKLKKWDGDNVFMSFYPDGYWGKDSRLMEIIFVFTKENGKWVIDDVQEFQNGAITTTAREQTGIR